MSTYRLGQSLGKTFHQPLISEECLICFGQNLSRVILNIQVHSTTNYHKKHTSFIANNNDMLNDLITRKLNLSNYYQRFSIVYHCWKHFKKSNNICILFIPQTPFNCGYYIHETSCKIFTINSLYNFDKSCKIAFIMSHKNRGTITCNWYTYSNV